jgi:hypothetical protein
MTGSWRKMYDNVDWIELAKDAAQWRSILNMGMNLQVLQKTGNFLTNWATISFSSTLFHRVVQLIVSVVDSYMNNKFVSALN